MSVPTLLHSGSEGMVPITGQGVTVAVVDSGVHYKDVTATHPDGMLNLIGQADFTEEGLCAATGDGYQQFAGYCWTTAQTSADGFGHGSHVANTIGSRLRDAATGSRLGVAPDVRILSVRVLGDNGVGTYEDVVQGIQHVVEKKDEWQIRVLNLSLTAYATTPYFVDPVNLAVEAAWQHGIVVVAAAGNNGPVAQSITVPGNDPYVLTVGAIDTNRTAGKAQWGDDNVPRWSASGPTLDGFIKPDVLAPGANVVAYMYNDPNDKTKAAALVQTHPNYNPNIDMYRLSGTSMATAVASGVVALLVQAQPELTPDQIKFRLMASAQSSVTEQGELTYALLQQGSGRLWAPDVVMQQDMPVESANTALNLTAELANPWRESSEANQIDTFDRDGDGLLNNGSLIPYGLNYDYYEGVWTTVPNFATLIPIKSGAVNGLTLAPSTRSNNYALHMTGCIYAPVDGRLHLLYQFGRR